MSPSKGLIIFGLMMIVASSSSTFNPPQKNVTVLSGAPTVYVSPEVESKTVKVVQSYGLQSSSSNNNVVPSNQGIQSSMTPTTYSSSVNSHPQNRGSQLLPQSQNNVSRSHYGSQPNSFIMPSHFIGYKPITPQVPGSRPGQPTVGSSPTQTQKKYHHQKIAPYTPNAQRRVDSDMDETYNEDEYEREEYRHEMEQEDNDAEYSGYHDHYPPKPQPTDPPPETRESPFAGFPVSGPGFVDPAPFDPLPPPPASIKGSVDYILIPLVLIGLAGPIFVVLYVILGAFEAKLSPIVRRSLGGIDAYKPYLDNLISSVGRALDTHECLDYAACQFGSFCNHLGYVDTYPTIQKTLDPFMPTPYKRRMRQLFNSMKNSESCSINNCIPSLSNY